MVALTWHFSYKHNWRICRIDIWNVKIVFKYSSIKFYDIVWNTRYLILYSTTRTKMSRSLSIKWIVWEIYSAEFYKIIAQTLRLLFSWMNLGTWPWAHLKKFSIATHNHIKSQILLNNLRMHTHFIERQTFHLMQKLASMHFLFLQIYVVSHCQ